MKFAHLADTHLGYRQYGLIERESDFYNVFDSIIDNIIEERVDFVIHSGDLFESPRPTPNSLFNFQNSLLKLKKVDIPFFSIAGNHDIYLSSNALPPQILFKKLGIKLISNKNCFFEYNDIFIGGKPYTSVQQKKSLLSKFDYLSKKAQKYSKKILVSHQGIDQYFPLQYELELGDIPTNFDYYAMGHIHNRILEDFGDGKLAYPGSTEIWRSNELKDYSKKGKGFYLVELGNDFIDVEPVNIELQREFIIKNIEYSNLNNEVSDLKTYISKLKEKPIVNLTIKGGNFSRVDVYEKINRELYDKSIKIRSMFKSEDTLNDEKLIENIDSLDPKVLLTEKLKVFDNEDIVNLAIELFDNFSNNRIEESEKISNKFFKEYFEDIDITKMDLDDVEMKDANLFSFDSASENLNNFDIDDENRNNNQE